MKKLIPVSSIKKRLVLCFFVMLIINSAIAQFKNQDSIGLPSMEGKIAWGDFNNDGNLDFLISGCSDTVPGQALKVYSNNGNGKFSLQTNIILKKASIESTWIDYNNDGLLDIQFMGVSDASGAILRIYKNNGDSTFTEQPNLIPASLNNWDGFTVGSNGLPACIATWGDYDNDGFSDLLLVGKTMASGYISAILKNNGNGTFSEQKEILSIDRDISLAAWGDYNNDGFLDILISYRDSIWVTRIYKNNGDGSFSQQSGFFSTGKCYRSSAWGDYNNDGFMDVLLTGWTDYPDSHAITEVYKNNGNGIFTKTEIPLSQLQDGSASWGDYNNDGFPDILLTGRQSCSDYKWVSKIYKNNGNETFTEQSDSSFRFKNLSVSYATWGDYNNDGRLDILLTGQDTTATFITSDLDTAIYWKFTNKIYKNIGLYSANTAPSTPGNLQQTVNSNDVILKWDKANDTETPQNGLSYNIRVGTSPGTTDIVNPNALISNGFRKTPAIGNVAQSSGSYTLNLPAGTYYWSVQAIDNAYSGGHWAVENSFTITSTQASNLMAKDISPQSKKLSWANGSGSNRIVFMAEDNKKVRTPGNGITYSANNTFGSGTQIDTSGWFCVYNGTGNADTIINLKANTNYKIVVFEYTDTAGSEYYNTSIGSNNVFLSNVKSVFNELTVLTFLDFKISVNKVVWGDYNNDGFLDFLLTGQLQALTGPNENVTKLFKNNGNDTFTEQERGLLKGTLGDLAWGDYNNDGFIDLIISGVSDTIKSKTVLYKNNGDGTFTEQTGLPFIGVWDGSLTWGDYNNDGYLDILLAGSLGRDSTGAEICASKIYKNNGDGTFTEQRDISSSDIMIHQTSWKDFNNDGFADILLIGYNIHSGISLAKAFKNNGDGTFTEQTGISFNNERIQSMAWGDYNNDGFLDILSTCDGAVGTKCVIFKNNGDGTFTEKADLPLIYGAVVNSLTWGDYNNDGYLDILMDQRVFKNNGDETFTEQKGIPIIGLTSWGDYNNDGLLDILVTAYGVKIYRNNGPFPVNTVPTQPANLLQTVSSHESEILKAETMAPTKMQQTENLYTINLNWNKATDDQTPQVSLSYNVRVGRTSEGMDIVSPMASTTSGFRRVLDIGNAGQTTNYTLNNLADGTYYWSVQAIDNNFSGGHWASEQKFSIPVTGIQPNISNDNISVYPNPANNYIKIARGEDKPCLVTLTDINGKQILNKLIYEKQEQINICFLKAGLYLIKLKTADSIKIMKLSIL